MTRNRNSKTQRVPRKTKSSEWWPVCMASRVTNVKTAFNSSSEPPAVLGQSNPLYVTWSGLCSCRFVFLRERPWQSIMIFRAIWQEAGSGYSWPRNDTLFCDPVCAVEHFSFDWSHPVLLSKSTKSLFNSVRTQQILYYQSINQTTCFGSLNHHQANSQTILKVHSVDVHIVGSQMFPNRNTIKCIGDSLVATKKSLTHFIVIRLCNV
jgi:hypothetical protein